MLPETALKREISMTHHKKIVAAVSSAVYSYLAMEQAAAEAQPAQKETPDQRVVFQAVSPWALAGRQAIMERSTQLQFRMNR